MASAFPKIFESSGRKLRIPDGVLNVLVPEIGLEGSGIVSFVRQREAAGVSEHMRMGREAELRGLTNAPYKLGKARRREWRSPLGGEYEGRFGVLLALQFP